MRHRRHSPREGNMSPSATQIRGAFMLMAMPILVSSFSTFIKPSSSSPLLTHDDACQEIPVNTLMTEKPSFTRRRHQTCAGSTTTSCTMVSSSSTSLNYQNESDLDPYGVKRQRQRRRSKTSSFAQRMQKMLNDRTKNEQLEQEGKDGVLPKVRTIHTLNDFKDLLSTENDKMIVVRWYAEWCRACASVKPRYYHLARTYEDREDILFVEVPVTEKNANLHQGLGVPTLPFAHIYYPGGSGLVEEMKMVRPHFKKFEQTVQWYAAKSCDIPDGDSEDPFALPSKEMHQEQEARRQRSE